ncbi:hypothetical protein [Kurthia gibsonii]|uniref:hypothetical protein n=1 Tax=Kurthia gibsonii TaxID=33946 RepID=UPI002DB9A099|nr:hypothetical protein [Kurthia gibsonii]MEB7772437.1 hypothetical protein [Kurthia gibsonii]
MNVKKIIENIIYIISIVYLLVSIIYYFINEDKFGWTTFFGTDALTLYGLVVTFLSFLILKITIIKKYINWLLLSINFSKIKYEISLIVDSECSIDDLYKVVLQTIKEFDKDEGENPLVFNNELLLKRFNIASMNTNVTIKELKTYSVDDHQFNKHKIEFKGNDNYRSMSKNFTFIMNSLVEEIQNLPNQVQFDKFYLKVERKNTDYNLFEMSNTLRKKNIELVSSTSQLTKKNSTLTLDYDTGIIITSSSRAELVLMLDVLADLLVG